MSLATAAALAAARLTAPLAAALEGPDQFVALLAELGLDVELALEQMPVIADLLPLGEDLRQLMDLAESLGSGDAAAADMVVATLELVRAVFDAVDALADLRADALAGLADPLDDPGTWADVAANLPGYLLVTWLRLDQPLTFAILVLGGVITGVPRGGSLPARYDLSWEAAGRLLSDSGGQLRDTYGWGGDFDHERLLLALAGCLRAAGVQAALTAVPASVSGNPDAGTIGPDVSALRLMLVDEVPAGGSGHLGVGVLAVPVAAEGADPAAAPSRLLLTSEILGQAGAEVSLGAGWSLNLDGTATVTGALGAVIGPDGTALSGTQAAVGAGLRLIGAPDGGWPLLGGPTGTRLELRGASLELSLAGAASDPELILLAGSPDGLALVIDPGDADSFLGALLGSAAIEIETGLMARWSSRDGVTLAGQVGFSVVIAVDLSIGPLHVDQLQLTLGAGAAGWTATATVTASALLGPLTVVAEGIGLAIALIPAAGGSGSLGAADLSVAFQPPSGVGIGFDVGVASGGGFLFLDPPGGRYAGVLDVEVLGIGICAFGLVDTKAEGVDGWSLFFALFIDLPSIQLGFGFTLTGVGGLAGMNRTLDTVALESAVRAGSIEAVLFPPDPIADAPATIDQLGVMFPPSDGRYVFGPVVRIGWGTPTLIEAELGVVISLPDPSVVAVIGTIGAVLPAEDLPLVVLHVDVAGIVDLGAGTVSIDSSLHDSWVVGFALSGDMSLRADFTGTPWFLMSMGGFHPRFEPIEMDGFPTMRRLALGISAAPILDIHFECYFAIAPNSVQFGAAFSLTADIAGFGIDGGTEFDAVVQFSPFLIVTHLGFHVSITAVGVDLAGVWLDLSIEGPNPWFLLGTARFSILGIEQRIQIDEQIGGPPLAKPDVEAADPLALLRDALGSPDAWTAIATPAAGVALVDTGAGAAPGAELAAAPDGAVTVSQRAVPLGVSLDKLGDAPIGGLEAYTVESAAGSMPSSAAVQDWFAPGYFFELDSSEQLSAPSFELLDAGIAFGGGEPIGGPDLACTLDYEQILRDPELAEDRVKLGALPLTTGTRVTMAAPGQGRPGTRFVIEPDPDPVGLAPSRWAVTQRNTGDVLARNGTWSGAHQSEAGGRSTATVVPSWEAP